MILYIEKLSVFMRGYPHEHGNILIEMYMFKLCSKTLLWDLVRLSEFRWKRAHRKKIGDMVPKWPIICMLLNGHNLHCIVSQFSDPWEHLSLEFCITVDFGFCTAHTHMTLINSEGIRFVRPSIFEFVWSVKCGFGPRLTFIWGRIINSIKLDFIPLLQPPKWIRSFLLPYFMYDQLRLSCTNEIEIWGIMFCGDNFEVSHFRRLDGDFEFSYSKHGTKRRI